MLICHVSIVAKNGQTKRRLWRRPFVFLEATIRDFEQAWSVGCNLQPQHLMPSNPTHLTFKGS